MSDTRKPLARVLDAIRYKRDHAERLWNDKVKAIRENPNRMNIRGIWQAAALSDLVRLHAMFCVLDDAVREAERQAAPRTKGRKP